MPAVADNRPIESKRASAIMGMATLSSKSEPTPPVPPTQRPSLPCTRQATIMADSQITGLTLPGMMDDPVEPPAMQPNNPPRGPDPIQRRSLAILVRDRNRTQNPEACHTIAGGLGFKMIVGLGKRNAQGLGRWATLAPTGWVLMPVPTAVPPMGRLKPGLNQRILPNCFVNLICVPENSCPKVTGWHPSNGCPNFTISEKALAFFAGHHANGSGLAPTNG